MKILVINSGSSSIKYQLFVMPEGTVVAKGLVQRIEEEEGEVLLQVGERKVRESRPVADHAAGLECLVAMLTKDEEAPLDSIDEIGAVGHRVVHGGESFKDSVLIDDEVVGVIEDHCTLAPLHNPPNLLGIRVARKLMPGVPQVAVFDTAFHQTLPPHAFRYALPKSFYEEDRVRRYGFHGTSHKFVAARAAEVLGRPPTEVNLITCHLGNGASMAAIEKGLVIDTSMGLTPLEGLVMGTRCGDIDPAILIHLARTRDLSIDDLDKALNKKSGLLGLSGSSNDLREILELCGEGNKDALLALDVYCYRIKKYIGAYLAALGRLDALVFTAGVGENSPDVRAKVCAGLEGLGIALDGEANRAARGEADISAGDENPTRVLVIPTNEEKLIATDTFALAGKGKS